MASAIAVSVSPGSVTGGNSSTGTVTLGVPAPAGGRTIYLTSNSAAATVPANVSVAAGTTSISFSVTTTSVTAQTTTNITASFNNLVGSTSLTVNPVAAFKLSSYPTRLTVIQGSSNAATASVVPSGNFSGSVTLTNSALPSGVTIAYGTNPTTGSSLLTFTAAAAAALGQSSVTITGTSGNLNSSVTIPLTVAPVVSGSSSNVALAFSTGEVGIVGGNSAGGSTPLTVTPVNGFTGPVSFSATGLPSGVSVTTNPTSLSITGTAAQTAQVTFQAISAVTPGYYPVAVTGSGNGGATSTAVLGLNILPPPNSLPFTLTVTDNTTNAIPTGIASATVSLATLGGYSNPITLSLADDPSAPVLAPATTTDPTKIGVSFSAPTLSVSGTSALTLAVGASVAPGAYHFVVTGLSTDGSLQRAAFTVFVAPENLAADPNVDGSLPSQTYTGDNPSYPLAAGIGDMERFDFDPASTFETNSGSHVTTAAPSSLGLHPNAPVGSAGLPDGTDDRKYVAATIAPPYVYPYRACVRITSIFPNGKREVGSGTLIGNNHVLTAAHVIFSKINGGMAATIYVRPGFDFTWSQTHSATYTTSNHAFVAKGYLGAFTSVNTSNLNSYDYDDWAIVDCNPITNGPLGQRGKSLGSYTQYMQLESADNVYFPEINTHIAGYPAFTFAPASPVLTGAFANLCPDLFETYVYNGDDGAVTTTADRGGLLNSNSLLFSTMDISRGDSGVGLWYFSDTDNDYHVYGVVDAIVPVIGPFGIGRGTTGLHTRITPTRFSIIKTHERLDGDEPPAVYSP